MVRGCPDMSRKRVFGVKMNRGQVAKIADADKFYNWGIWLWVSPKLASTVFARWDIHLHMLGFLAFGNAIYFAKHRADLPLLSESEQAIIGQNEEALDNAAKFFQRLLTWTLASYVMLNIQTYYVRVKSKVGAMLKAVSNVVSIFLVIIDYDQEDGIVFSHRMHDALTAMCYYALHLAAQNTKFRLTAEEMEGIFNERNLDGSKLLNYKGKHTYKKVPIQVLKLAIMKSVQDEVHHTRMTTASNNNSNKKNSNDKDDSESHGGGGGCLSSVWFDSQARSDLRIAVEELSGAAMSVSSCVSNSKLPFAYNQLMQFTTRIFLLATTFFIYRTAAEQHISNNYRIPFSCFSWDDLPGTRQCPTDEYIYLNVVMIIQTYFLLGCLNIFPMLTRVWENGLCKEDYLDFIDLICESLLNHPDSRPKSLHEWTSQKSTTTYRRCSNRESGYDSNGDGDDC